MAESTQAYKVKVGEFEGPLDALLTLVDEKKLSINDVSLSVIADDFLAYVKSLSTHDKELIISFLGTTATLLLIKSITLLPGLPVTQEEVGDIHELERRLALYKLFKDIGEELAKETHKRKIFFQKNTPHILHEQFAGHPSISRETLHGALVEFFKANPVKERLPEVMVETVVSLEEMISNFVEKINQAPKHSFSALSGHGTQTQSASREQRLNVIVSFLALLELVKQEVIDMQQENPYDEITIESQKA
jgi:segregation and condensation protein A